MDKNLKKIKEKVQNFESDLTNEEEFHSADDVVQSENLVFEEEKKKRKDPLKSFGIICILIAFFGVVTSLQYVIEVTPEIETAISERYSSSLSVGTILLTDDDDTSPQDYTITHNYEEKETKIWIWDYAAEDGDYVQIFVNGEPLGDAFMINHKPLELMVPAETEITVKGIRDGGGGITYALRFDLNSSTYFNAAPVNGVNTYTLIKGN